MARLRQKAEACFFEKKQQKTFGPAVAESPATRAQENKSFLVFFQKRTACLLSPPVKVFGQQPAPTRQRRTRDMAYIGEAPLADPSVGQSPARQPAPLAPTPGRILLLACVVAGAVTGFVLTNGAAAQLAIGQAGPDLTRLLRAMAGMKALAAAGLVAGVLWRLAAPVGRLRLGGYGLACAAMAAGPGLIWDMSYLRLGALLLHGGLLATVLLLWRDPAMHARLGEAVARRRAVLKARGLCPLDLR